MTDVSYIPMGEQTGRPSKQKQTDMERAQKW